MKLYDIQRRCEGYINSADLRPTIRRCIQEALYNICASNPPGKDFSFLKHTFRIAADSSSTGALRRFFMPSNFRSFIEFVSLDSDGTSTSFSSLIDAGFQIKFLGNCLTIEGSSSLPVPPGEAVIVGYRSHPDILVTDASHLDPTWDTEWTPSYPPASACLLPDEAYKTLVYAAMLQLKEYESEVAFSIQDFENHFREGLDQLIKNYALQVFPLNPPDVPTVDWLIAVGTDVIGSERYQNQLLEFLNELAVDFSDIAKIPLSSRPLAVHLISDAPLPSIDSLIPSASFWAAGMRFKAASLAGSLNQQIVDAWEIAKASWHSLYIESSFLLNPPSPPTVDWLVSVGCHFAGGKIYEQRILAFLNELAGEFADVAKVPLADRPAAILLSSNAPLPSVNGVSIPAEYWAAGMRFKASYVNGNPDQSLFASWEAAKSEWLSNYYTVNVHSDTFGIDTFGGLVKYIRTEWKSCRNDHQAWTIANEAVDDVMSRVNTDALLTSQVISLEPDVDAYPIPSNCKTIIKIEINGKKIPGRSFDSQGPVTPNMTRFQYIGDGRQAFRLVGDKIVLDLTPSCSGSMTVFYQKDHVWTLSESAKVPVKPLLVIKAIKAAIALEEGNAAKAQFFQVEYEKAIAQYNANQGRIFSPDDRIINATPSVNHDIMQAFK